MSEVKVNKISPRTNCGTVQLGDSGDTITIPAGATITNNGTQTGFGRTGAVDWQTSIKTGDFTAVSGEGYFINTTSGTITMTLPASPSVGDIVAFKDYAGTFDSNNLTINRNGSNIVGGTDNPLISVEGQAGTLVYGDATQGWQIVEAATDADLPRPSFITATGGTITTSGNCKIHTFTGPGTFCVSSIASPSANNQVSYIVVAGGGGSARVTPSSPAAGSGGGGAGGFREDKSPVTPYTASPLEGAGSITVTATAFPITVGGGGGTGPGGNGATGDSGSNSVFSTITSAGGGGGANFPGNGAAGGSGGAGRGFPSSGGSGNTPSVSPAQGKDGGNGADVGTGGGGGGAGAAGTSGTPSCTTLAAGPGGAGVTSSINGTPTARAGGGGGSAGPGASPSSGGTGGTGGGGNGGCASGAGQNGTANTGGGGGGGQSTGTTVAGHNGGSGIVIIRYKFQ